MDMRQEVKDLNSTSLSTYRNVIFGRGSQNLKLGELGSWLLHGYQTLIKHVGALAHTKKDQNLARIHYLFLRGLSKNAN